ncbi:unannotated protein [freshwater metagenome]|uniref:Unannotated protein n=1 Tax=freshwater metagenome TaxID=449393 RepID=A0A6J5ZN56_9ZZZZ
MSAERPVAFDSPDGSVISTQVARTAVLTPEVSEVRKSAVAKPVELVVDCVIVEVGSDT